MRQIISLITFSVSSILKQSNPLRRRLRCRRIRKADAERDGSVSAGDAPSVPGSSFIRQPVAGRICFLFTRKEISKSHGGGNRIEWLPQPWLHWFPPTQEALDPEFKLIQLLEGRVDPLTVGVWQRKLKAREAGAYFQYSDANGGQWRAIGRPRQTQAPIGRVFFANASKSVAA